MSHLPPGCNSGTGPGADLGRGDANQYAQRVRQEVVEADLVPAAVGLNQVENAKTADEAFICHDGTGSGRLQHANGSAAMSETPEVREAQERQTSASTA